MLTRFSALCFLMTVPPLTANGQPFIVEDAHYSFLFSGFDPIEGCEYSEGCVFSMDGVVALGENKASETLSFTTAEIALSGHPHLAERFSRSAERLLLNEELVLASIVGEARDYTWQRIPPSVWVDFKLSIARSSIRLTGGYDRRPADGSGVLFDAEGIATWFGDANLDLNFNSTDLVQVFRAGLFEDGVPNNAKWRDGDWNGDGEFDTTDLVVAFRDGGYETGHRVAVPVPEFCGGEFFIAAMLSISCRALRRS